MTTSSKELLKIALEMEKEGQKFYEEAAKNCRDQFGQDVFATLSKDETVHIGRIKIIYESLDTTDTWTDEWLKITEAPASVKAVFEDLAGKHRASAKTDTIDLKAFDMGIDLEERSVALYEKLRDGASDPKGKEFAIKMIAEEKAHLKTLQDTKFYLTDPEAYFLEIEKAEYDAG